MHTMWKFQVFNKPARRVLKRKYVDERTHLGLYYSLTIRKSRNKTTIELQAKITFALETIHVKFQSRQKLFHSLVSRHGIVASEKW